MNYGRKEFICQCFYLRNIFIKKYKIHVTYQNDEQFDLNFRQILRMKGCSTDDQYKDVLNKVKKEISRRKSFHKDSYERYKYIQENYSRLHRNLWNFDPSFVDERIKRIVDNCKANSSIKHIEEIIVQHDGQVHGKRLYQFPVFTETLCQQICEEVSNFENSTCPKERPNTMNKYGVSLDEVGLSDNLLNEVIIRYIRPIAGILFDDWGGHSLDSFKAFIVMYGTNKDSELSLHYDNAEVTLNVCLTSGFEGGNLEFGSLWKEEDREKSLDIQHQKGVGILHRGRQMHKALPTLHGHRCNLIIWMRSSTIRNQCCPMCEQVPSLLEVPFGGDGFISKDRPSSSNCISS